MERSPIGLVEQLVDVALGVDLEKVVELHSDIDVGNYVEKMKHQIVVCWLGPGVKDQVLAFWQLVKAEKLVNGAYVIFTGIDSELPCWSDLDMYVGGAFGSIYLLTFDANTAPGVKPSQRGTLVDMS